MRAERRKTAVLHNQAPGCAPCPLRAPRYSRSPPPVWGVHERVEVVVCPFFTVAHVLYPCLLWALGAGEGIRR